MSRLTDELPINEEPYEPFDEPTPGRSPAAFNFVWLALHQVLLRVGWIFKTESIVIPAFMKFIGGGPVMLGLLPVFNRIGFSVVPLLCARRLKITPLKKWFVVVTTMAMAAPFAVLSALHFGGLLHGAQTDRGGWMPAIFLAVYAVFFAVTGVNTLAAHALQGKLIRADRRGRLFMASVLVGAPLAIAAAWLLLPRWLEYSDGGFGWVFGAVAAAFVLAGLATAPAAEEPDNFTEQSTNLWQKFQEAWLVFQNHADARAVGFLAALVSVNFMLFPHYATFEEADFRSMTAWVCVQNAATALFSLIAGPLADRFGNRAALRFSVVGISMAPLSLLVFLYLPEAVVDRWYWLVFAPIGFMPLTVRLLINYTLEISSSEDHPKYVSAIGICLALPVIVGSPLVGWLVGAVGSGAVFAVGLLVLLLAGAQTFRLSEPRNALRAE